jgi:hypothetical protein
MTRHLLNTTLGSLAVVALPILILGGSALGGEAAQTRIAWKGAVPQSEEIVKWVYEGCAAYPVTRADLAAAEAGSKQEPALLSKGARSVQDVDSLDHAQRQ